MVRAYYCITDVGVFHDWRGVTTYNFPLEFLVPDGTSQLKLCPEHDGLPFAEGPEHLKKQKEETNA